MPDDKKVEGGGLSCELPGSLLRPATPTPTASIEEDAQAILACEKIIDGANAHRARGLIQAYKNWCYVGDLEKASEAKRNMYTYVIAEIRRMDRTRRTY